MRSFLLSSGLVGLAVAAALPAPAPQDIDFDLVYSLPNPTYTVASDATAQTVVYNPSTIFADALPQITATTTADLATDGPNKRAAAACTALPTGAGPVATPDTPADFMAIPDFANNALGASTPSGYTQVFSNLNASNNAYGYLGYTTLKTYDVATCAAKCNAINGCLAFNIYYERDPSLDPGSGASGCTNPPSTTFIKCAFWGGPLTVANAVNYGQWRNQFRVVIAGSNGYVSNSIASVPGYGGAIPLGNAAINAPFDANGFDSYMGVAMFTSGPFNASLCARACSEKSAYAIAHPPTDGSPVQTCQFFNTYILYINSTSNPNNIQGQYCAMYSESWPQSYATNVGQYRGSDHFLIQYSFAYSNSTNPGSLNANAAVHQASKDISWATLQPFCSSYLGYAVPTTTVTTTITSVPVTTTTTSTTATSTVTTIHRKRDETTTATDDASDSTATIPPHILDLMQPSGASNEKRALSTPNVLTKYPATILSAACSLQATPATSTVTISSFTTTTAATVTATATSTAVAVAPQCTTFRIQVAAPGSAYDGTFVQNIDQLSYFTGISTDSYYTSYSSLLWSINLSTGFITTPKGFFFGRYNAGSYAQGLTVKQTGDYYGSPVVFALDPYTLELTGSVTQGGTTYSNFYVGTNGLTQIFISGPGRANSPFPIPARLYAVCAA